MSVDAQRRSVYVPNRQSREYECMDMDVNTERTVHSTNTCLPIHVTASLVNAAIDDNLMQLKIAN